MFSGIQEILIIIIIFLGIFIVPRMMKTKPTPQPQMLRHPDLKWSWTLRLAIVGSLLWPACCALYIKPWQQNATRFTMLGLGPVVIGWSIKWVLAGIKNKR